MTILNLWIVLFTGRLVSHPSFMKRKDLLQVALICPVSFARFAFFQFHWHFSYKHPSISEEFVGQCMREWRAMGQSPLLFFQS